MADESHAVRFGLRENLSQFSLLVVINVFVGMMVGLERTVVPLIGEKEFGLTSKTAIVSFIVSFGVTKAICNLFAARISEGVGRKKVLVLGPHHFRKPVVLVRRGECPLGDEPGALLVHDRDHEGGLGWPEAQGIGAWDK